jgi:glycosyltransferase involved in cell wall biosynthesis
MESVTLTIMMPVFNERRTVEKAIDDALTAELPVDARELIIVDDGSTDGTRELLDRRDWPANVKLVHHGSNAGKGAAVRTALRHATGQFAAILDADLEYKAADLALVLASLVTGEASVVFGKRSWTAENSYSSWYAFGNKAMTLATNVLFNCHLSDVMTCHKAMRTDLFRSLPLREPGFAIEPEIAAQVLRAGEHIHEVPIAYQARTREEGKKLTVIDGLRVLRTLVRCRLAEPSQSREGDPSVTVEA